MKITKHLHTAKHWVIRFVQLQLFVTLISLPILLAWGLPISALSPIGNLVFNQVLTLFLFLSSLIFFCELLFIPNGWLIYLLEKLIAWWIATLETNQGSAMVGFAKPSPLVLIAIPLVAVLILVHKKSRTPLVSSLYFCLLFVALTIYLKCITPTAQAVSSLTCNRGSVTIINNKNELIVVDPGYIGQRTSATSWVQYTLIPHIISSTGKTVIDHLVLLQPGNLTFQAVQQLCTVTQIGTIYLVYWDGEMERAGLRAYYQLQETANGKNIRLVRMGHKQISVGTATNLTIKPVGKLIKQYDYSYPALVVEGQIDKQKISIYSAKYTKKIAASPVAT